jgi:hypothetical protein
MQWLILTAELVLAVAMGVTWRGLAHLERRLDAIQSHIAAQLEIEQKAAAQRAVDAEVQRQKSIPEHKLWGAKRTPAGWIAGCSCGFQTLCYPEPSLALDEVERHKSNMPLRRAG